MVRLYREAIKAYRPSEPVGYRHAGHYIKSAYGSGAAQLLAMVIGSGLPRGDDPLLTVARTVFPSGHTAFLAKPDIPTYLVGNAGDLLEFEKLVPAPNESYTGLFWPGKTEKLDEFIQRKEAEEREARRKVKPERRLGGTSLRQQVPQADSVA